MTTTLKTLPFANVHFVKSSHASGICLGIEATTPLAETPADKKAAAAMAKEAISQAAALLFNYGATNGKAHFTHERFAYVLTTEAQLQRGLESMLIQGDLARKYRTPRADRRNFRHEGMSANRQSARTFRESITFERIRLGSDNADVATAAHKVYTA